VNLLWLSDDDVAQLVTVGEALPLVEEAFRALAEGRAQMPAKMYLDFKEFGGDLRAMPAYLPKTGTDGRGFAGVKVVNSHPGNPARGLPTVSAVLVLNDPETGLPLAIMAAGRLTDIRTGAAGGVAAKHLARPNSETLGLVGCGRQAVTQWRALAGRFPFKEIRVAGQTPEEARSFIAKNGTSDGPAWRATSVQEAAGADIVVTTTPGRAVVVSSPWVRPGAHVNAIGADAPGKQELDVALLKRARVFVDSPEQAFHSGEVNVGLSSGAMTPDDIAGGLGDVVAGRTPGRRSDADITVFDSTGLAVQDVAVAAFVYRRARERSRGQTLTL
jgi:alanine dehydrogenase